MRIPDDERMARQMLANELNNGRYLQLNYEINQNLDLEFSKYVHEVSIPLIEKYNLTAAGIHTKGKCRNGDIDIRINKVSKCVRLIETVSWYSLHDPTRLIKQCGSGSFGFKRVLESNLAHLTKNKIRYITNGEAILTALVFSEMYPDRIRIYGLREIPRCDWDPNLDWICFGRWYGIFKKPNGPILEQYTYKNVKVSK